MKSYISDTKVTNTTKFLNIPNSESSGKTEPWPIQQAPSASIGGTFVLPSSGDGFFLSSCPTTTVAA